MKYTIYKSASRDKESGYYRYDFRELPAGVGRFYRSIWFPDDGAAQRLAHFILRDQTGTIEVVQLKKYVLAVEHREIGEITIEAENSADAEMKARAGAGAYVQGARTLEQLSIQRVTN